MLALVALPFTVNGFVPTALGALGQSRALLSIAIIELIMTIFFAWIAAPYGIVAVAASHVLHAYCIMPYQLVVLRRYSDIDVFGFLSRLIGPLTAAVAMAVIVFAAQMKLPTIMPILWVRVVLLIVLGGTVYAGALLLLARKEVNAIRASLRPILRRHDPVVVEEPA